MSLFVHLLSSLLIKWPAHLHLASLTFNMTSFTLVSFLTSEFLIVSLIVIFSTLLSIALCEVMSFCSRCLVVSPCFCPLGHCWYYTLVIHSFLRHTGNFWSQRISLYLPKQLHPAFILIITSSLVCSSNITVWPRYLYLSTIFNGFIFYLYSLVDWKFVIYFVFPLWILSPIFFAIFVQIV